jgi:hypothetical protein
MAELKNYVLGRGELFFDQYLSGTMTKTGELYFGTTQAFGLSVSSDNLDHYSMESGVRTKDDTTILEIQRTASFTTDNVNAPNLAMFLLGSATALTVAGGSIVDELIAAPLLGHYYQLGQDNLTNIGGARDVSAVAVKDFVTPATIYTVDVDYTVDLAMGRLYIIETGSIPETGITVDYTEGSYTRDQIITSSTTKIEGALRFISHNSAGKDRDFYLPRVKISPNGEFALKGDSWQRLAFAVEVLQLSTGVPSVLVDGRPYTP